MTIRKLIAEFIGTAGLLAVVVGSGILAERLAGGNVALALLVNTIATAAALLVLILTFGPVSGAHLNPVVTLANLLDGGFSGRDAVFYILAQITGAVAGVVFANVMFDLPAVAASVKVRTGVGQWLGEFAATFGLIVLLFGLSRIPQKVVVPFAVAAWVTAAIWFTASTCFSNPAVTIARSLTDTFTGVRPADVPAFIVVQVLTAIVATYFSRWLFRVEDQELVVPHE